MITKYYKIIIALVLVIGAVITGYMYGKRQYSAGYDKGYDIGYKAGYEERNRLALLSKPDAVTEHVKTETKIVYQKVPYTGTDVQVKTEPPKVTVEVNGKKQEIVQKQETADLSVKTETAVKIKIPERRWKLGIGTDGKSAAGMLSFPVKGAVGGWVAGSKGKVMGGISISF